MKFVTMRVYHSDNIEQWRKASIAYQAHMEELKKVVPASIIELADPNLVDDGLVLKVDHDRAKRKLVLTLRCGNLQIGYYDVVITYLGVRITPAHDKILARIARSTNIMQTYFNDIHFHEFTVNKDGRISHRFLINPGVQFAISCKTLSWKKIPRKGRRIRSVPDRYVGGPDVEIVRPVRRIPTKG